MSLCLHYVMTYRIVFAGLFWVLRGRGEGLISRGRALCLGPSDLGVEVRSRWKIHRLRRRRPLGSSPSF